MRLGDSDITLFCYIKIRYRYKVTFNDAQNIKCSSCIKKQDPRQAETGGEKAKTPRDTAARTAIAPREKVNTNTGTVISVKDGVAS